MMALCTGVTSALGVRGNLPPGKKYLGNEATEYDLFGSGNAGLGKNVRGGVRLE